MRRANFLLTILMLLAVAVPSAAKSYKLKLDHAPRVAMTGTATNGYFVKAFGIASNADKALDLARMDAVAAALFYGISPSADCPGNGLVALPPLLSESDYLTNKAFFDNFFKQGNFLKYISDVNSAYPTGKDNVKTPAGRQIGIELVVDYNGLRAFLQDNGLLKKLDDHFKI